MFSYETVSVTSPRFEDWLQLRTHLYLEGGLIVADDLDSSGTYTDAYDDYSIHVLATDQRGDPVGCCRLIEGNLGPLQVEHLFEIDPLPSSFEVSGCGAVKEHRKSFLTVGLYRAMFQLATEMGYAHSYMEVEQPFFTHLRELGMPLEVVGETRYVYNALNNATVLVISDVVTSLREADKTRGMATRIGDYFGDPFTWSLRTSDILAEMPDAASVSATDVV